MLSTRHRAPAPTAAAMLAGLTAIALLAGCATATDATDAESGATGAAGTASAPAGTTDATAPVDSPAPDAADKPAQQASESDERLLYIIEEEKLAHDVYAAMDELYGKNPFTNIMRSEIQHQEWLVPIIEARGLDDPRTGVEGTFTNPEIQALYDEFVAKSEQSWADAVEVGITIEEADIVDLKEAIEAETDADTIAAYERLLSGSENHLVAFQRQQ